MLLFFKLFTLLDIIQDNYFTCTNLYLIFIYKYICQNMNVHSNILSHSLSSYLKRGHGRNKVRSCDLWVCKIHIFLSIACLQFGIDWADWNRQLDLCATIFFAVGLQTQQPKCFTEPLDGDRAWIKRWVCQTLYKSFHWQIRHSTDHIHSLLLILKISIKILILTNDIIN